MKTKIKKEGFKINKFDTYRTKKKYPLRYWI